MVEGKLESQPVSVKQNLRESLTKIHKLRLAMASDDESHVLALADFREVHKDLLERIAANRAELDRLICETKTTAVSHFNASEDKDKHPVPGLDIRVGQDVIYEEADALNWGIQARTAVKLDKKLFESIAKKTGTAGMQFIKLEDRPEATIATDLGKALNGNNQPQEKQ